MNGCATRPALNRDICCRAKDNAACWRSVGALRLGRSRHTNGRSSWLEPALGRHANNCHAPGPNANLNIHLGKTAGRRSAVQDTGAFNRVPSRPEQDDRPFCADAERMTTSTCCIAREFFKIRPKGLTPPRHFRAVARQAFLQFWKDVGATGLL